ncbi:M4 family metallopeptidase [Streptomyces pathocidini]|uniref:M4 family metallopeptidase n=1 Tax=Streptomyces pathocidini TaxID=1650571 RepID=UPI003F4CF0DC
MTRTPEDRPSGRRPRRRTATTGALVAVTALLAVGVQSGTAAAHPDSDTPARSRAQASSKAGAYAKPDPGALPAKLSPAQRAELIREADATKAETADSLGLGAKEKLVVRDVVRNADGATHTRYERTYDGLPVLGGDLVVHETKAGEIEDVTQATKSRMSMADTTPAVPADTARAKALTTAKAQAEEAPRKATAEKAPRKVVWAADGTPVLAWETVIGGLQRDGTPSRLHVITDAETGRVLYTYQAVRNGTGSSQYSGQVTLGTARSGSTYQLNDTGRGGHRTYDLNQRTSGTGTLFTDADDVWGSGSTSSRQTAGVDAHFGAALTWDYYKNVHGRSGIRGDGVGAYSRVHYGNNYVNAFWDDSCFCMTYGDGSGNAKPLTSIDVAAHEMTHGVTSATAGLIYSGESGGLNEATSDIFAATVEFYAANASDVGDYLVGEKININGNGTPLRYMDKPSKDGASKDSWYSGVGGVDVHYSSGVANHFFYLLSEGSGAKEINGVRYDSPTSDGLPVSGIGRANAEKIWFKALTERFRSSTNYAAARTGTLQAAADLFGQGSATYNAVANAWAAVNVGSRVTDGAGVFEATDDVAIPDAGAAVTSSLTVNRAGSAPAALGVEVDIVHTYRGDLVIDLIAPDGTAYRLKNSSSNDSADNVQESYTVDASSETASGSWKLQVQDVYAQDTGYVNSWKLTF